LERDESIAGVSDAAYWLTKEVHWLVPLRENCWRKKADNCHLVIITALNIANAPHQKYAPYDSGIAGDQFVTTPNGSVYVGDV
jgi:hypothetical protein